MNQFHKNPRQITVKQNRDLENWLRQFGDLSGIVHDLNSDEIIGGNQRGRIFDISKCKVVMTETLQEPDEQGTVGLGYVVWEGKKYNYRQVRWNEEQCDQANLIANKAGGSWDYDILANQFDLETILASGFEEHELGLFAPLPDLDDLGEKFGEPGKEDFWPVIKIKVPPEVMVKFNIVMSGISGKNETEKFCNLLERISANE